MVFIDKTDVKTAQGTMRPANPEIGSESLGENPGR
jgi:hypothetical protein